MDGWVVSISLRTITNVMSVIPAFFSLVSAWIARSHLIAALSYFLSTAKYYCVLAHIDSSAEKVGAHVGDYQSLLVGFGFQLRGKFGELDTIYCLQKQLEHMFQVRRFAVKRNLNFYSPRYHNNIQKHSHHCQSSRSGLDSTPSQGYCQISPFQTFSVHQLQY